MRLLLLRKSLTIVSVLAASSLALADEIRVEQASLPIPFQLPGADAQVDRQIEASAIEPIGDGKLLLVAHDKTTAMFVAETATGRLVGQPLTCARFPNGAKVAPKWEGLARDDQGWYYVIGTHSGKTDDDRRFRSYLFRFRLIDGSNGSPVAIDEGSVRRWELGDALKDALSQEVSDPAAVAKRKIEGLTVRTVPAAAGKPARLELVIGLREPGDLVRTFAADITKTPANDATLTLTPLFHFDAGRREGVQSQLTSLNHVPEWNGFLIVTATEDELNAFHGNTLWFLPDTQLSQGPRVQPIAVSVFEPAQKAEGLCVLPNPAGPNSRSLRLAISFDNDPHSTHIPSRFQVLTLSRRAD